MADCQPALDALIAEFFPPEEPAPKPTKGKGRAADPDLAPDDARVVELICRRYPDLWRGEIARWGDDDSRADLALCNQLAFFCHNDTAQIDRLFRQSGLMREKWDRADYREKTIGKATTGRTEFYDPNYRAPAVNLRLNGKPLRNGSRAENAQDAEAGGTATGPSGRPKIVNNERQLRDLVAEAGAALAAHNVPPVVFDRGGNMVRVREDRVQGTIIETMDEDAVRLTLSHTADWFHVSESKNGEEWFDDLPSTAAVAALLSLPAWPGVPYLAGVTTAPIFTGDGSLLTEPGYHPVSGYLFQPDPGMGFLAVPERPTPDDIRAAVALLNEPIEEFPFADEGSRASALGVMIEPFARELIDGPTPLRLFEAPTEGTGKTLLLQTITAPAFGPMVDPIQEVEGVEE